MRDHKTSLLRVGTDETSVLSLKTSSALILYLPAQARCCVASSSGGKFKCGYSFSVGTVKENNREIRNDARGRDRDASRRCAGRPSICRHDGALATIELGGRHASEFGGATHGSWCRAVPPTKLVVVAAGAGGSCCLDGPVVRAAS